MVCINRQFIDIWSDLFEEVGSNSLAAQSFRKGLPTEYFEYDGSDFDTEDAMYSTQTRHYDAAEGRCLNEDPVGFEGDHSNLYRYPGNAPE